MPNPRSGSLCGLMPDDPVCVLSPRLRRAMRIFSPDRNKRTLQPFVWTAPTVHL